MLVAGGPILEGIELGTPIMARYEKTDNLVTGFYAHQVTQNTPNAPRDFIVLSEPAPEIFYGATGCSGNGFVRSAIGVNGSPTFSNVLFWRPTSNVLLKRGTTVGGNANYSSRRLSGNCVNGVGTMQDRQDLVDSGFKLLVQESFPWTMTML